MRVTIVRIVRIYIHCLDISQSVKGFTTIKFELEL